MTDVRAAVRIRPAARSGGPPLSIKGQYGQFAFDYVVEEGASQEGTFNECILPQVNNFLQGSSSAILVYGASSTGKSYTLEGGSSANRTEGAIPRALQAICKNLAVVPKHRYKLYITYCALSAGVEALMVDLLAPGSPPTSLKEASATGALARLLHYQVESSEDIYEVLRQGRMTRTTVFASASANASGSSTNRSGRAMPTSAHSMLNIQLTGFAASGEQLATNLTFVELAAPEAKDLMGYPAAVDGGLARSLSLAYASLTAVITALRAGTSSGLGSARNQESPARGRTHVPWRDSPLTRWLKGCLDMAGSILVIATVAPGSEAAADTLATLSYVNRLRSGPRSDGLLVTATWDSTDSSAAAGLTAAAAQQELMHSLQRTAQAQRERQERERQMQERERERVRFGSPIQVRASPSAASSVRGQGSGRFSPSYDDAASLDARYLTAAGSGAPSLARSSSVPRNGGLNSTAPAAAGAANGGSASLPRSLLDATPAATPRDSVSTPRPTNADQQQQQQQQSSLPQPFLTGGSSRVVGVSQSSSYQQQHRSSVTSLQQQQSQQQQAKGGPLTELLASLQLGEGSASQQGLRLDRVESQQSRMSGQNSPGASALNSAGPSGAAGGGGGGTSRDGERSGFNAALDVLGRQVEQLRAELEAERRETARLKAEASHKEAANRSASELLEANASAALSEARSQVESMRKQLETSENARQLLNRRVQQLEDQQSSVLDIQAESSMLEAQVRALQDRLSAVRSEQASLEEQLADARAAADAMRQDRDRLQRQNHELSEKLQGQVRNLGEETSRLRSQAMDAAELLEAEQVARRAAETALQQLRVQVENSRSAESSALQQAAALAVQVKDMNNALETVRAERNKLQDAKWRSDERAEQLSLELEAAATQRAKLEMDARVASSKAESDLRSAISAAEGMKIELSGARAQVESLKQELRTAQQAAEDAVRRESTAHIDMQEMESLLRELDRDLEVQVNAVWRQLRAERADSLFGVPEGGAVAPARRWRPVLQALVSIMKRNVNEAERQSQALEHARERVASLESQVSRTSELATSLAAHQQLKAAHMSELEESRRSIALMDQALTEANLECQRLHRQLEDLTTAHKALTTQAAEREATLQAQLTDREERLRSAAAEHDRKVQTLKEEWDARMQMQVAERESRLHAAIMDADAKVHGVLAERDARIAAAVADGESRLRQVLEEEEARFHDAVSERDARISALASERDNLQRQLSTFSTIQGEDRQERDLLRLKAHARDQLLNLIWSEVRTIKVVCASGASNSPQTPMGVSFFPMSSPLSSPRSPGRGMHGSPDSEVSLDWGEAVCQERLLKSLATVRAQVTKLHGELGTLRNNASMAEEMSGQLSATKTRLAEAQRSVEDLTSRLSGLDAELRDEQRNRCNAQQQLASSESAVASLQASLSEARQTVATLQEEVAVLSKSRDTWKDTAAQQEAQLKEMYAENESRANELSRLRSEAQSASAEANGATGRIRLLESQLQDAQGQLETLTGRLAGMEKALTDANARISTLTGQMVLADSEARLKAQELMARAQAAEDAEKLAKANAKEAVDRLEARLREATDQGARLVADVEAMRLERSEAQQKVDDMQRQLVEARARLVDSDHVSKQLQKLISERDNLQDQANSLRNSHVQATEDVRSLRRALESTQEHLQRVTDEKTRLAAQLEQQRLEAIMSNMAPRTTGRIGALIRPTSGAGSEPNVSMAGAAEAQRAAAPASYVRPYTGLTYPAIGAPYSIAPSVGASPSVSRHMVGLGSTPAPGGPFTPAGATTSSVSLFDSAMKLGLQTGAGMSSLGVGSGGSYGSGSAEDPMSAIRVHVRTSPPHSMGEPRQK
ncbi:hypothetical protein Agub_g2200 [Astrephomene gubernaculifera]|uniref:Kinesin motor domain-containing protein n=1 Tax=Astrephomene gubernaculifera TaxID=47775 RepID=A0AAD3DKF5_9CHLO|nr:hypothetical protein Agub_g2200 [Astrephomene gubernaculifera]